MKKSNTSKPSQPKRARKSNPICPTRPIKRIGPKIQRPYGGNKAKACAGGEVIIGLLGSAAIGYYYYRKGIVRCGAPLPMSGRACGLPMKEYTKYSNNKLWAYKKCKNGHILSM